MKKFILRAKIIGHVFWKHVKYVAARGWRLGMPFVVLIMAPFVAIVGFTLLSLFVVHTFDWPIGGLGSTNKKESLQFSILVSSGIIGGGLVLALLQDLKEIPTLIHDHWASDRGSGNLFKLGGHVFVVSLGIFLVAFALRGQERGVSAGVSIKQGLQEVAQSISDGSKVPTQVRVNVSYAEDVGGPFLPQPRETKSPMGFVVTFNGEANRESLGNLKGPGMDLHEADRRLLDLLVADLSACGAEDPVELVTMGYSSSSVFKSIESSENANLEVANARAAKVKSVLDSLIIAKAANIQVKAHAWEYYGDMAKGRGYADRRGTEYSMQKGRLNRRVEVILDDASGCHFEGERTGVLSSR